MEEYQNHLKDISAIRSMMEQSTKFISLSGLSGIAVGIIALLGVAAALLCLDDLQLVATLNQRTYQIFAGQDMNWDFVVFFFADGLTVLVTALLLASFFSIRLAKKKGLPVWNKVAWNMVWNLMVPLAAGGLFCFIQVFHGSVIWISSTTLIFYGMALLNASKFTVKEIRWLGISEIVLGLICALWVGAGLLFWAIGFGVLHILYGIIMYFRYEREGHSGKNK